MDFQYLTTERLNLRMITPALHSAIFEQYEDADIKQLFGFQTNEELEKERLKHTKGLTTYNRSFLLFQLIEKENGIVIGAAGFHNWMSEHSRSEIGYALNSELHMGQGYMSEAIRAIIDYGFSIMGLNRIEAFIGAENMASQRLINKMNFTLEGTLREHFCKNNILEDSLVFSLLKNEYSNRL